MQKLIAIILFIVTIAAILFGMTILSDRSIANGIAIGYAAIAAVVAAVYAFAGVYFWDRSDKHLPRDANGYRYIQL